MQVSVPVGLRSPRAGLTRSAPCPRRVPGTSEAFRPLPFPAVQIARSKRISAQAEETDGNWPQVTQMTNIYQTGTKKDFTISR